jgi:hypothetical protein
MCWSPCPHIHSEYANTTLSKFVSLWINVRTCAYKEMWEDVTPLTWKCGFLRLYVPSMVMMLIYCTIAGHSTDTWLHNNKKLNFPFKESQYLNTVRMEAVQPNDVYLYFISCASCVCWHVFCLNKIYKHTLEPILNTDKNRIPMAKAVGLFNKKKNLSPANWNSISGTN